MEEVDPMTTTDSPRLPIELCEHIIDAAYDYYYQHIVQSLATLSTCAYVCRAWRSRAQMNLFASVLIKDGNMLHRLASLLDESPYLRGFVHRLVIRGYLHIPASPAVLFPTVMRLRLPKLTHVYLQEITPVEKAKSPLPPRVRELPSVPIHPYFPSLLSTFNYVRRVDLVRIRLTSFGELCRILTSLSGVPELFCDNVSWAVFGTLPSCVVQVISREHNRKPFLPKLRSLTCYDMDEQGREALVASLGPSVSEMSFAFPNITPPLERAAQADLPGLPPQAPRIKHASPSLNLSSVPNLTKLVCLFKPGIETDAGEREAFRATLQSWVATARTHDPHSVVHRRLYLRRFLRTGAEYAPQEFVSVMSVVGQLVEYALCEPVPSLSAEGSDAPMPQTVAMNVTVIVLLCGQDLEPGTWARTRVAESLPTFSQLNRLAIISEDS